MSVAHVTAKAMREIILRQSKRAHVGHIGSGLSIVEILVALYGEGGALADADPDSPERDRFVLSKGHAALALYAALALGGRIPMAELDTYCGTDSRLGVHSEHVVPGIDFSTGSLGQGLTMATGAALAARLQGSPRRVYCLVSDAESNEGSIWEAVMFAAHHRLANLTVIVDSNRQQALGHTRDVIDMHPATGRWQAFGWEAVEVDGHDAGAVQAAIQGFDMAEGRPHVVIADTVCGKGVGYMERQVKWHYWPMSDEEFSVAMREIGSGTSNRS
jgi:transketolase